MLYTATRQALLDMDYKIEEIKITSQWIGLDYPLNYYGAIIGDYAVVGFYALGLDSVKHLLSFLASNEKLLKSLAMKEYRMYLESYLVQKVVVGYMRFFDELVNFDVLKMLVDKLESEGKLAPISEKWGLGFGVYKRLWSVNTTPPSYPTTLSEVKNALSNEELGAFEELISSIRKKT